MYGFNEDLCGNTLQHATIRCNTLRQAHVCYKSLTNMLKKARKICFAILCNTLQHAATHSRVLQAAGEYTEGGNICIASHCNTLQHFATLCNTLTCVTSLRRMCWRREDLLSFPRHVSAPLTTSNFDLISGVRVCVCVCVCVEGEIESLDVWYF
jgi:hypothetical protein